MVIYRNVWSVVYLSEYTRVLTLETCADVGDVRSNMAGARRTAIFWSNVLPIYARYKFTEWKMKGTVRFIIRATLIPAESDFVPYCGRQASGRMGQGLQRAA